MQPPVAAIDVHTHLFPARLQAAVRRALTRMYGWSFDLPDEPGAFAEFVRARGTERFCVLPYAHKPGMARELNAWMAETTRRLPGAIGFACVHPDDSDSTDVLEDAFADGLIGVKLHHQVQEVSPDDPRLFPVYELMLEHDRPLIVHAGKGPTDNGLVGASPFRRMMKRFPHLRICVAHLGFPEREEFVAMLDEFPRLYLDTSGLGNMSLTGIGLEDRIERILWGSDAPNIAFDYERAITRVLDLGLEPDDQRAIFRDNALRFLRLER